MHRPTRKKINAIFLRENKEHDRARDAGQSRQWKKNRQRENQARNQRDRDGRACFLATFPGNA